LKTRTKARPPGDLRPEDNRCTPEKLEAYIRKHVQATGQIPTLHSCIKQFGGILGALVDLWELDRRGTLDSLTRDSKRRPKREQYQERPDKSPDLCERPGCSARWAGSVAGFIGIRVKKKNGKFRDVSWRLRVCEQHALPYQTSATGTAISRRPNG
jgi:hypothetical protein